MTRPILVGAALDGRDGAALALGALLARLSGNSIALAHAYPYEPLTVPTPEYEDELRSDALRRLGDLAADLSPDLEVSVHAYARISAAHGLHETAERLGAAAIVVGSSHRGRAGRVLLGTVATRLLHGSPCPVAVAPAGYHGTPPAPIRIGVAYDGKPEARAALQTAIALAERDGASVSVYTVEEPLVVVSPMADAGLAGLSGHAAALREEAVARLETARELVPSALRGSTRLMRGRPEELLADVSGELDLLLCGSRGYGPFRAVLLGGVSAALARNCRCPLLVLPRGHRRPFIAGSDGDALMAAAEAAG